MLGKMVVIPYEKYLKLLNQNNEISNNTLENNQISNNTVNTLHEVSSNPLSNDLNILESNKKIEIDNISKDLLNEEEIIDYIPKNYKNKCKLILNHMRKNEMKWDSNGRLILGNECINDTHIVDLLRGIVSVNKKRV